MTHPASKKPPREVELKLAVPDGTAGALMDHAAFRTPGAEKPQQRHEVTTYFDTPDQALSRSGISLRVRRINGRFVQTLKANPKGGVAADRAEWEWPVKADKPDLTLLAQTPFAGTLPHGLHLQPVLVTDIERTLRILHLDGGTTVEAAFDEGAIIAGQARKPVRELELELKAGDAAPLFRLALELHATTPLRIESQSKAARGYHLVNGTTPAAHKAEAVALDQNTSGADAFRQILTADLGHLLDNQPAALAGDTEGVHQMRIAIRRLRAALTLFQPLLEANAASSFQAELRRVGRAFGEARDWDVFTLQVLPDALEAAKARPWHDLLQLPANARRQEAHQHFAQEVLAPPFTTLVLGLAAWAEEKALLGDPALEQPIDALYPPLLDRLARKVDRRGRHIGYRSDPERHALRKALKKLRYAIDYLRSLLPAKPVKSYLRKCKKTQETLGGINDAVTAIALADHLIEAARPDLAPAVGALARVLDRRRNDGLQDLTKRWKAFHAEPRFWA
jgi:triphosphatase